MILQRPLHSYLNGRPLLSLPPLGSDLVYAGGTPRGGVSLLQPFVQQGLQFAHVLEAELQGFKPADGGLGENVAVQCAQGQAHVRLGEAELDPPLFELLCKVLQVI